MNSNIEASEHVSVVINIAGLDQQPEVRVVFSARPETTIMAVLGFLDMAVDGNAMATLSGQALDTYFVIDISDSMALGASESDQQNLYNEIGCVFACHVPDGTPESTLSVARRLGIPLRLDVLKASSNNLIDEMSSTMASETLRVSAFSFHHLAQKISDLTTDYQAVKNSINSLAIGDGLPRQDAVNQPGDTVPTPLMTLLDQEIDQTGPQKLVIFVTDGTQSVRNPWLVSNAFDPSMCERLKSKGVDVAVIYAKYNYWGKETDPTYNLTIALIEDQIEPNLKTCSSKGLFASGDDPAEINAAFRKIWSIYKSNKLRLSS